MENKKITSALISVFDKSNLEPLIKELVHKDVTLYSTGGTKRFYSRFRIRSISG